MEGGAIGADWVRETLIYRSAAHDGGTQVRTWLIRALQIPIKRLPEPMTGFS